MIRIDPTSPTWQIVKEHCEREIERARTDNETVGTPDAKANSLRGEINALRAVLALGDPKPEIKSPDHNIAKR